MKFDENFMTLQPDAGLHATRNEELEHPHDTDMLPSQRHSGFVCDGRTPTNSNNFRVNKLPGWYRVQ